MEGSLWPLEALGMCKASEIKRIWDHGFRPGGNGCFNKVDLELFKKEAKNGLEFFPENLAKRGVEVTRFLFCKLASDEKPFFFIK